MHYSLCNLINLNVWEECCHIRKGQSIEIYCLILTGSHPVITFENVLYLIYGILSIGSFDSEFLVIVDHMLSTPIPICIL